MASQVKVQEMEVKIPTIVKDDPWLEPYIEKINNRIQRYNDELQEIDNNFEMPLLMLARTLLGEDDSLVFLKNPKWSER